MDTPTTSSGSRGPQAKRTFAGAARFTVADVAAALVVLGSALWWVSGCKSAGGVDTLAQCGMLQRNFLAIGAPLVLFLGGAWAFVRTIQVWRARGRWWIWQGAGWFMLLLMLVFLMMTAPLAAL